MNTRFMKWGVVGSVLFVMAAFAGCNAVAGADVQAASTPTVWISLESSVPVDIDNVRTAQLKLDFSKAVAVFKDDLSPADLAKLFDFSYDYKGSAKMTATSIKKHVSEGVYILTVANVPSYIVEPGADSAGDSTAGVATLTINQASITPAITPATREWSVNGEVVPEGSGSAVMLDFRFEKVENESLDADLVGWIDQKLHKVTVAAKAGTDLKNLTPTIMINSDSICSTEGEEDFTLDVTYTVTALGGATQDYVVSVTAPIIPPPIPDTDPDFVQIMESSVTITGSESGTTMFPTGRTVTLSPYKISKYETTWALWDAVVKEGIKQNKGYVFTDDNAFQGHQDLTPETRVPERTGGDMNADTNGYSDARLGKMAKGTSLLTEAEKTQRSVTFVSWYDIIAWCNLYSELTGRDPVYTYESAVFKNVTGKENADGYKVILDISKNGYRLPTEAEWEFAARGGAAAYNQGGTPTSAWTYNYAGGNTINNVAWYYWTTYPQATGENFVGGLTDYGVHPVGKKAANSLGLYDMTGNVMEVCWDRYLAIGSLTGTVTDPTGPADDVDAGQTSRMAHGGHWTSEAGGNQLKVTDRVVGYQPTARNDGEGFRLAHSGTN